MNKRNTVKKCYIIIENLDTVAKWNTPPIKVTLFCLDRGCSTGNWVSRACCRGGNTRTGELARSLIFILFFYFCLLFTFFYHELAAGEEIQELGVLLAHFHFVQNKSAPEYCLNFPDDGSAWDRWRPWQKQWPWPTTTDLTDLLLHSAIHSGSTVDPQWIHSGSITSIQRQHRICMSKVLAVKASIPTSNCWLVAGVHSCKVGHSIATLDVLFWNNEKAEKWEEVAIEGNQERTVTQIHRSTYSLLSFSFCSPHSDYSISRKWVGGWERTDWPPQPQGSTFGTFSFLSRGEIKNGTTLTSATLPSDHSISSALVPPLPPLLVLIHLSTVKPFMPL